MSKDLKIELDPAFAPRLRSMGMNWACTAQRPFTLRPSSFTTKIEGLKPKTFSQQKQLESFDIYHKDPTSAGIFGIASAPNDGQAKLMAAYMMQLHLQADPGHRPVWHDLTGSFSSELMGEEPKNCTMIVLNNVGPDAVPIKKEKMRDILERYSDLPIVVVVNGSDPFTFFTRDMRKALTGVLYLTGAMVKKSHEI